MEVKLFDNGGRTVDRYTVIIGDDVYTMDDNPLDPQGVNQWAGKRDSYRKFSIITGTGFVNRQFGDEKEVKIDDLPPAVAKAVLLRMQD